MVNRRFLNAAGLTKNGAFIGLMLAALPLAGHAESNYVTGASGTLTATARLDFSVTIERFLFLRVGSGATLANNSTVDVVNFPVTGAANGNATAVPGSATAAAQVRGNGGTISFSNTTPGSLSNGLQTVSYASISATAAALAGSPTLLNHPGFVNGAPSAVASLPATAGVVDAGATWSFKYANTAVLAAGTYGATLANNGRVTYTAVMP
jgi:hypothetical protein